MRDVRSAELTGGIMDREYRIGYGVVAGASSGSTVELGADYRPTGSE